MNHHRLVAVLLIALGAADGVAFSGLDDETGPRPNPDANNASNNGNTNNGNTNLNVDPAYSSSPAGELRLRRDSLLIDARDPASACTAEPSPNGCRVNIGASGNTADATASAVAGTPHCDRCP